MQYLAIVLLGLGVAALMVLGMIYRKLGTAVALLMDIKELAVASSVRQALVSLIGAGSVATPYAEPANMQNALTPHHTPPTSPGLLDLLGMLVGRQAE